MNDYFDYNFTNLFCDDVKTIRLYAPTAAHHDIIFKLDSMLSNGQMKIMSLDFFKNKIDDKGVVKAKENKSEDDNIFSESSPKDIVDMLKMVPSEDGSFLATFCGLFKELLLSPEICKTISKNPSMNDVKLGEGWLVRISRKDFYNILGEYLKNFFT